MAPPSRQRGFTLFELAVVAAVFAILVALFLSTFLALAVTALVLKALTHRRARSTTEAGR